MPSEMEFVNYKDFVKNLTETESPTSADKVVVSNPTNGPRAVKGFPVVKIIDRGNATVATLNALTFKQDGWSYYITDNGMLSLGSVNVTSGDIVAWNATNSVWYKLRPMSSLDSYINPKNILENVVEAPMPTVTEVTGKYINASGAEVSDADWNYIEFSVSGIAAVSIYGFGSSGHSALIFKNASNYVVGSPRVPSSNGYHTNLAQVPTGATKCQMSYSVANNRTREYKAYKVSPFAIDGLDWHFNWSVATTSASYTERLPFWNTLTEDINVLIDFGLNVRQVVVQTAGKQDIEVIQIGGKRRAFMKINRYAGYFLIYPAVQPTVASQATIKIWSNNRCKYLQTKSEVYDIDIEALKSSTSYMLDATYTHEGNTRAFLTTRLPFAGTLTENVDVCIDFCGEKINQVIFTSGSQQDIRIDQVNDTMLFASMPANTYYLRVYPSTFYYEPVDIRIQISKKGTTQYTDKLAINNRSRIDAISGQGSDEHDIKDAIDQKTTLLCLSAGVDSTAISNGTSKYDQLRRTLFDKDACNEVCGLYYNLRRIAYEGYSFLSKDAAFVVRLIECEQDEDGNYIPHDGDDDFSLHPTFQQYMTPYQFGCFGIGIEESISTFANNSTRQQRLAQLISLVRKMWHEYKAVPIMQWMPCNPYVPSSHNMEGWKYISPQHPFVIKEILNNQGSTCGYGNSSGTDNETTYSTPREWFEAMCGEVSDFLNELVDTDGTPIPCILRLWQEPNRENWWWGSNYSTPDEFKEFFNLTATLIKSTAHNVLFGYCTDEFRVRNESDFMSRCDAVSADVIGFDDYRLPHEWNTGSDLPKIVTRLAESFGKVPMMFETGYKKAEDETTTFDDAYNKIMYNKLKDDPAVRLAIWQIYSTDSGATAAVMGAAYKLLCERNDILTANNHINPAIIEL